MCLEYSGLVVPVCTPFDDDNKIDERAYIEHLELLSEQGVRRILVNGTTAEFFSLTIEERHRLMEISRENFDGTVMLHVGCDGLKQTAEEAVWAQDKGADAIVSIAPYYFASVSQQGLIDYFNELAKFVKVPFILYNFPKHTQNALTPEVLVKIEHFGMKDSSADLSLVSATPRYYMGGDQKILEAYKMGAFGFVSARANGFAPLYVELERALQSGDPAVDDVQARVCELKNAMTSVKGIAKIKCSVAKQIKNYPTKMRLPLTGLTIQEISMMEQVCGFFRS